MQQYTEQTGKPTLSKQAQMRHYRLILAQSATKGAVNTSQVAAAIFCL
jgi:hypothetical protein